MKNLNLKFTLILCLVTAYTYQAQSQGCVAIRSGCGTNINNGVLHKGQLQIGTNARYFQSYKHFRGKEEEKHRVEEGTEVINNSLFLDLLLRYAITDRLSLDLVLPYVYHDRSSKYEHGGNPREDDPQTAANEFWPGERHTTSAQGLSDIRFGASYWVLNPTKHHNGNFSVGLGMKLRSGDYRVQDTFYNQGANKDQEIIADVDQSILLGDGGIGMTFDLQGYYLLLDKFIVSGSFYYLSNPREKFEYKTRRGETSERSVPDQYASRLGVLYMTNLHGLGLYGGGRIEGVPSSDLIGGDEGGRRPGYAISIEPGINYTIRNLSLNLTVPIAIERNRTQSFSDKVRTRETGVFRNGDAAFADYLINLGVTWRLAGKTNQVEFLDLKN